MSDCSHSAANGVTRSTASEKETTLGQGGHRHRLPAVPTASFWTQSRSLTRVRIER